METLLTAKDVAAELVVPVRTAQRYMREQMVHVWVGKHLRVTRQALTAWLQKQQEQPAVPPAAPPVRQERRRGDGQAPLPRPMPGDPTYEVRATQPRRRKKP